MKIKVKYFGRRIEGRKAPEEWLHEVEQMAYKNANERANGAADQLVPNPKLPEEWFDVYCKLSDEYDEQVEKEVAMDKKRIFFQDEDICGCCEQQVGAVYPWDREEEHSRPSYYNYYGDCEACVLGCCECIEDHA